MALGIFKRKEKKEEPKEKKVAEKKIKEKTVPKEKQDSVSVVSEEKPSKEKSVSSKPAPSKQKTTIAWMVIKEPHITEKATILAEKNEYVFKVFPKANKPEIKKAIEEMYGVEVEDVRIINVHKKRRRRGRVEGWRKGYKKAIVKVKEGQTIEILPR